MPSHTDEDQATRKHRPLRRGKRSAPPTEQQRLFRRRGFALGGIVLVLFLLVITVRGCLDSRKKSELKEYTRGVAALVQESDKQVSQPFFALLGQQEEQAAQEMQTQISGYQQQADTQLKQAEKLDVPKDMQSAQRSLLIAMEFRRNGLAAIAQRIPTALGNNRNAADEAVQQIAAQMQTFLASDVVYQARVVPLMQRPLKKADLGGQSIPRSNFLPDIEWISPTTIASRLGVTIRPNRDGPLAPGLHGTALQSVTAGGVQLSSESANRLPGSTTDFVAKFINEGEHEEFDLKVTLTMEGGPEPVKVETVVPAVEKGAVAEAHLKLKEPPPTGVPVEIRVAVAGVPGEKNVENNKGEYQVLFNKG